jgi:hypothetical protein
VRRIFDKRDTKDLIAQVRTLDLRRSPFAKALKSSEAFSATVAAFLDFLMFAKQQNGVWQFSGHGKEHDQDLMFRIKEIEKELVKTHTAFQKMTAEKPIKPTTPRRRRSISDTGDISDEELERAAQISRQEVLAIYRIRQEVLYPSSAWAIYILYRPHVLSYMICIACIYASLCYILASSCYIHASSCYIHASSCYIHASLCYIHASSCSPR